MKFRLDESPGGIKLARRNISNLRYAVDTILMAESKKELKNFLMRVREESEKVALKLVKRVEHRRTDAFELWCWRRLLRGPWTARRSNQSILKETSAGCSLEGLMLKLKLLAYSTAVGKQTGAIW